MDGTAAISSNLDALKRILAGLVAMAGLGCLSSPLAGEDGSARRGNVSAEAQRAKVEAEPLAEPGEGSGSRPTLPRHLRLAILRLLRPAESAARRLIIASARGLVVALPPPRKPRPKPATAEPLLRRFGIAVVMSPDDLARAGAAGRAAATARPRILSLPLLDPLRRPLSLSNGQPPLRARTRRPAHPVSRRHQAVFAPAAALARRPDRRHASQPAPRRTGRRARRSAGTGKTLCPLEGTPRMPSARKAPAPGRIRRISPLRPGRPPGGRLTRFDPPARLSRTSARSTRFWLTPMRLPSTRCSNPTRHDTRRIMHRQQRVILSRTQIHLLVVYILLYALPGCIFRRGPWPAKPYRKSRK